MNHDAGAPGTPITGINVTPLVDVTLVLLIIFMVTAKLVVSQRALPVDLPQAASGQSVQEVLSLILAADGAIELNGERLTRDEDLLGRARAACTVQRELRAVIKADSAVPHGRVMRVLDLLRLAGVFKIGFGVLPSTNVPPGPDPRR